MEPKADEKKEGPSVGGASVPAGLAAQSCGADAADGPINDQRWSELIRGWLADHADAFRIVLAKFHIRSDRGAYDIVGRERHAFSLTVADQIKRARSERLRDLESK